MDFITPEQHLLLVQNGGVANLESLLDLPPVLKLFTPDAAGTWLISAIDPADHDRAWGLCDPGLGSPELGWVSLAELARIRGPFGSAVRCDEAFPANSNLRAYAVEAQRVGIVIG